MEKDAKDYADSIHAIFVETSAKNAININELFIEISKYCELVNLCNICLPPPFLSFPSKFDTQKELGCCFSLNLLASFV